jgi:hypothetical protein
MALIVGETAAWEDVRFASWGSFGGELPELDNPCMQVARTMAFTLLVATPPHATVQVTTMALQPPSPPTLQEALNNDRAQFEDCTPCRVVGTAPSAT